MYREPWKTVDVIKGFHWLSYAGGKFSTSRGRGVFTDAALEEFPADLWRWWLISNASETSDCDFTTERFVADVNMDLADVFSNLVNRVLVFTNRTFDAPIPHEVHLGGDELALAGEVNSRLAAIKHAAPRPMAGGNSCFTSTRQSPKSPSRELARALLRGRQRVCRTARRSSLMTPSARR